MTRKIVAAIVSAAIAATAFTAAPAKADLSAVEFLAGATALVIIGSALSESSSRSRVVVSQGPTHPQPRNRVIVNALPKSCIYQYKTWNKTVRMFSTNCLNSRFGHVASLPGACSKRIGSHYGYGPACLRNYGYRVVNR